MARWGDIKCGKILLVAGKLDSLFSKWLDTMWQIKSVFKKDKTGIRNGQRQYYSDFI